MKDPLQRQQTPYELLGVGRDASAADIDKAFKLALVKRVNVQKLTGARVALERPVDRAVLDLLHYDDAVAARLSPDPRTDASALDPPRRAATAAAWESQLRRAFPDYGIVHALAVLWYWWALSESERMAEDPSATFDPPLPDLWRNAIACWAMVVAGDDFWQSQTFVPRDHVPAVQSALGDRLAADVHRFSQISSAQAEMFHRCELTLKNEIRTAKALAAAELRANRGRLACGALMLERMGLLAKVRQQIVAALEQSPGNAALTALRDALSPFSAIAALIESKQLQAAIDEIDRLPPAERDAKEVWKLESRALFERGRQEASLGNVDAALDLWKKALAHATTEDGKRIIHEEVVNTIQTKAAALQGRQQDEAIRILDHALRVVRSQKLELTLGEILTSRGVGAIIEAQKQDQREEAVGPEVVKAAEKGVADLERAVKLGSKRAEEQLAAARNILASLIGGIVDDSGPAVSPSIRTLITQAGQASEEKEWATAIDLLRRALREAGAGSEAGVTIRKHLATALAQRSIGAVQMVMTMMQRKEQRDPADLKMLVTVLDAAHKDLREAADLDPSSDFVRDNLRQVQKLLDDLGVLAQLARGEIPTPAFDLPKKKEERHLAHGIFVAALVVLAMFVVLTTWKNSAATSWSKGIDAWLIAVGHYGAFGPFGYRLGVILGWPAAVAAFIMCFGWWFALPGAYLFGVVCGTRWWKKDPFAKLVEIAVYVFAITYLTAMVQYIARPKPEQTQLVAAKRSAVGRPAAVGLQGTATQSATSNSPAPSTATPASTVAEKPSPPPTADRRPQTASSQPTAPAATLPAGAFSSALLVQTLQTIESWSNDVARQQAASLEKMIDGVPPSDRPAALFCLASAYGRSGDRDRALRIYQDLAASAPAPYKKSAEFRLTAMKETDPSILEARYQTIAQRAAPGLFLRGGTWTSSDTRRAALQGMMDLRADRKSIRLFNFLHGKSFFPPPYAYLFILLALGLAVKVVELPFLVQGARMSLLVPRLRGEYARLKLQYGGNPAAFGREITALYQRNGVSPAAGCVKIAIDLGFVVWVMLTLRNYAPQLSLDGAKFLWTDNVTGRDAGVLVMWVVAGLLTMFLTPQMEQGQTAKMASGSLLVLAVIAGAAWYWTWPAYLMIFWTALSLLTTLVHFVMIGVLATRN